ncbi:DUF1707 domain-containing protein [Actinoallomurus sp. NPDC052308]|uniref:DUF1707 SHOCT-like domain-containing protein n=1 Tax=Actinoallomurus sp. NPDC052308 TaxID=3155530 RepID=UPI003413D68D
MNSELRIGDAERDAVASALHEHFAQGRLDREELDERLSATLAAKTVGDLRQVARDLPASPDTVAPPFGAADEADRFGRPGPQWGGPYRDGSYWGGPRWHGRSWAEPHLGGPPWARHAAARRMAYGGRHPRFAPRAGVFLIALFAIAAVTRGWFLFPLFAVVWCAMAFAGIRHARRHRLSR